VVLERSFGAPTVTKDGVRFQGNRAEGQVREHGRADGEEVASKTSDVAGTARPLRRARQSIVREGMKFVASGMNPMDLNAGSTSGHHSRRGAEEALQTLHTSKEIAQSAHFRQADEAIGKIISMRWTKSARKA